MSRGVTLEDEMISCSSLSFSTVVKGNQTGGYSRVTSCSTFSHSARSKPSRPGQGLI